MEKKDPLISMVKGMAIILVVYGHVIQRSMAAHGADFYLNPAFKFIYTFHMPLFFFISGYLMAWTLGRTGLSEAFKIRCKTLLVPYMCWGVLGLITYCALHLFDRKNSVGLRWDGSDPVLANAGVWFLFVLFVCSVFLLCSVKLQERLGMWGFAAVYLALLVIPGNDHFYLYYIKWFYLFYAVGYLCNKYSGRIREIGANKAAPLVIFILFILLASYWTKLDYIYVHKMHFATYNGSYEFLRFIYRYVVGFLGIAAVFYIAACFVKTKMEEGLAWVGLYSLDIFLVQRYIVEGIYPKLAGAVRMHFDFNGSLFMCIVAPLCTAFFVYVCIAVSKALIRKNPLLNTLLLGARNT